ncbi:MAG: ribonuclease R [Clostridia bacterium]|nr:ribonuclease R [Clostridia bacterium]
MKREIVQGKIQGNARGYAFLILGEEKEDYFIPHSDLKGAMHGDTVLVETTDGVGVRTTARVLKILERGITQIVGTYFTCKSGGFVSPDDSKYFNDIFIPFGKGLRAKAGDKVACKILSYPKNKKPEGIVCKIFGRQFNKNAEIESILYSYKLPQKFPKTVIDEVCDFSDNLTKKEIENRKDLRDITTFTIDGEDARDFDDAVSIEKKKDKYVLGVHIADVTHYVKPFGEIDKEAFNRATSVYFPEKVIPMLPERLCNDLCSLKEGVDRLTLSCIMTIDKNGKVVNSEITPSIIRSSKRFTYTTVQRILDNDKKALKENSKFVKDIFLMEELSDILFNRRLDRGSIDLDVKESAIAVSNDKIIVKKAEKDKAHALIEEFMISANCAVAEYVFYLNLPFIYRIHGKPTEERLEKFYLFMQGLGVNVKRNKQEVFPKDFQLILKNAENTPYVSIINRVMLRTMQKAKYSPNDIGHFGLGKSHYCHFTSPIRRYPDLVVHRILKDLIKNGSDKLEEKYGDYVLNASNKSSEMEKQAEDAERAVDEFYKIMYISEYVGEEFEGVISGVTSFGIFVELENGIEGIVKLENLAGSKYKFDEQNYVLSNSRNSYKLGQSAKIVVLGVNIAERRAEFVLIEDNKGFTKR